MQFLLATSDYNNSQSNTTKVKVHLKNGVAEIFDQHQDLMGRVDNNIVEIETNFENRIEKSLFVVQDAVFIVSSQGLNVKAENKGTSVYVYAKRVKEIPPNISLEEISKQYEKKKLDVEVETQKLTGDPKSDRVINSRVFNLKDEVEFLKKVFLVVKEMKS